MNRENESRVLRNAQIVPPDFDAQRLQPVDFFDQGPRVDHHPVSDER